MIKSLDELDFSKAKVNVNGAPQKWKNRRTKETVTGIKILNPHGFQITLPSVCAMEEHTEKHKFPQKMTLKVDRIVDGKKVTETKEGEVKVVKAVKCRGKVTKQSGGSIRGRAGDWILKRKDGTYYAAKDGPWNASTGQNNPSIIRNSHDQV